MTNRTAGPPPQVLARAVGLLYLVVIGTGIVAELYISGQIVVGGDAEATAAGILAQEGLFRLGFTLYLIEMACQLAQVVLFYLLLKPVSRSLSLVALVLGLLGVTLKTLGRLFYISPLLVLGEAGYLSVFSAAQQQALALLLLEVNDQAAGMALPFFGLATLLNGALIYASRFLPRFLGVWSILGGIGWLAFAYPPLGHQLFPYILAVGLAGSAAEILWLLIRGVNVEEWNRRAAAMV
jgi:hypothetical protein